MTQSSLNFIFPIKPQKGWGACEFAHEHLGKKILVTGANGFIGRHLVSLLQNGGYQVRPCVRTSDKLANLENGVAIGDLNQDTHWKEALQGIDVVIHLAARAHILDRKKARDLGSFWIPNVEGTKSLVKAAIGMGIRRIVFLSTIGVLGNKTFPGHFFSEQDPPQPSGPYSKSKWEAEKILQSLTGGTNLEWTILRPPLVYGPKAPGNFGRLVGLVRSGIPLPIKTFSNQRHHVFVYNLCHALITSAFHPHAAGKTFLISDDESISTSDLIKNIADASNSRARLFPFPCAFFKLLASALRKGDIASRLIDPLLINSSYIRNTLSWSPPFSLDEAIRFSASAAT